MMDTFTAQFSMLPQQAVQMKFEQTLDGNVKQQLAQDLAMQLFNSDRFIIYTQADPYTTQTSFSINIDVIYK